MPDIEITDQLGATVKTVPVDLAHPSSLVKYLKTELLRLAVIPDFLGRKDHLLSQAAPRPIEFEANAQHHFQLGSTTPEIDITPQAKAAVRVNASPGSNLFEGDPFHIATTVPDATGYVSAALRGSLDLGVGGTSGDLTFGFNATSGVSLEYLKAFPLGAGEPSLIEALSQTMAAYVIPADISDLVSLGVNDVATVSGHGSLKVSGGVTVSAAPNPLASVDLPLGAGTVAVKAGTAAGLSASFTLSGSYQVRARRRNAETIELSFSPESGTNFKADFSGSGGITAKFGETDLITAALGAISTDPTGDKKLLAELRPDEAKTLAKAIKDGLDHSLQASLDVVLSVMTDDQAAFQYEIQPALLSPEAAFAVRKALDGDLGPIAALEDDITAGAILAPGLKMLSSVLTETRKQGVALRINLLGILNYFTVSELIRNSEVVFDAVTGEVTIKDTVKGTSISAISEPLRRSEALRKAIFDSVLVTSSYRAGRALPLSELRCQQVHFALNQNTNHQIMGDYLSSFVALGLLSEPNKANILAGFNDGGPSTCVVRTSFGDAECALMFLDANDEPRDKAAFIEIGRQAMRALLDPVQQAIDRYRYQIVDDALWPTALGIGATRDLGPLVGLDLTDPRVVYLSGDVMTIMNWAQGMAETSKLVKDMRSFVAGSQPADLLQNNEFRKRRDALQKSLAAVVGASRIRFDEPWGMVCLFWAAGSPRTAHGKITTPALTVERT